MNGLYGTYIEVFLYHGIQSREINHAFCGSQTLPNGFILELLIHLWTCFFEIGLVEIEDVINLQLWVDIVVIPLVLSELLIIVVLDVLFCFFMYTCECGQHNRGALFSFVDANTREFVAVLVYSCLLAIFVFCEVQTYNAVKGGITGSLPSILFLHEHQNNAVHAIVVPTIEVFGQLSYLR